MWVLETELRSSKEQCLHLATKPSPQLQKGLLTGELKTLGKKNDKNVFLGGIIKLWVS